MDAFEPQCREIAAKGLQSLLERDELEFIGDFAHWFAVRIQSASLGWPPEMCEPLRLWTQKNHQATFAQDRPAMAEIAREFEGYVLSCCKFGARLVHRPATTSPVRCFGNRYRADR